MGSIDITWAIPIGSLAGLAFAAYLTWYVFRKDSGTPEMQEIAEAIRVGASAFMRRQYRTIIILSAVLAVVIALVIDGVAGDPPYTGVAFFFGAGCSALSGYIGMYVSVRSNIRTASAARRSLNEALVTSLRGGAVSGFSVVALSLLGVSGVFFILHNLVGLDEDAALLKAVGYAFGASFAALFAQLGGGIYTKAADVGADLVGKIEAGIPEDDPRNPAVIADLVGDNVGDCAGRGADLFESTAAENIGAMVLGIALWDITGSTGWIFFPLVARALGIFAAMVGVLLVRIREHESPMRGLNRGYYVAIGLAMAFFFLASQQLLGSAYLYFFASGVLGIVLSLAIVYITEYYTSGEWRPVREIARSSETGPATNIISGFSVALETTALPIVAIGFALLGAFALGQVAYDAQLAVGATPDSGDRFVFGLYGTAIATMGMLSTAAFILAMDTFGPITDNAGGIMEMSHQPEDIRRRTDRLDAVGNTTKALTKGYAMGSAALAAFLLFGAYFEKVAEINPQGIPGATVYDYFQVDLAQPAVFVSAMIGAMLVFLFASLAIRAVGRAAYHMINEVRRQFREIPGLMERKAKPDYASCVDIATRGALKAMVLPGILPVVVPIALGLLLRFGTDADIAAQGVGGLLMVGTIAGVLLANFMNNGGGAWDNAKKYIEAGHHGGKRTPAHAAAVVGDTVGDPFKDTAGPSIHVLVKLLSTITLVFASLFIVA